MRVIAIYNQKGGSGKTTTAVNLAGAFGELGLQTLLIDLDPQASATAWFGKAISDSQLRDVFMQNQSILPLVEKMNVPGVYLVGSSIALGEVGFALREDEQGTLLLGSRLQELPQLWDYILLDSPPTLGFLSLSALAAADEVLLPVEDSPLAFNAVQAQEQIVQAVRQRLNPDLQVIGFLLCRTKASNAKRREARSRLKQLSNMPVLEPVIRENRSIVQASVAQKPVTLYAPRSNGSRDYRRLARTIMNLHHSDKETIREE